MADETAPTETEAAPTKTSSTRSSSKAKSSSKPADGQDLYADALEKGYLGTVPDENPNSAYSLESGPDSPPLVPDNETSFHAPPKENPDA